VSAESIDAPVLVGGKLVLFPHMRCSVHLRTAQSLAAIHAAREAGRLVAVFANRFESPDEAPAQLHHVGTLAEVHDLGESPCCGRLAVDLEGVARVRIGPFVRATPYREASCAVLPTYAVDSDEQQLALQVRVVAGRIRQQFPGCLHTRAVARQLMASGSPEEVLGAVGGLLFHLHTFQRQQILELEPLSARLEAVLCELQERLARAAPSTVTH
jgi:ATP-dependent Lon protease